MHRPLSFAAVILMVTATLLSACSAQTPTATPTAPTATATAIPLPRLTLQPGNFYFSRDGQPVFLFSRNIAGYQVSHIDQLLDWTASGGSSFVRLHLDDFGMGYLPGGGVDENWAVQWDQVFNLAEAKGIYILPVFSVWCDWNAGGGYSTWQNNPLNKAKGGPVADPLELFVTDSTTQLLWLDWMETLVKRWVDRRNILAWEIFSEVNLATNPSESNGIAFVNMAAARIRAADPVGRPVTASIADTGLWPNFYRKTDIDFINLHPYPPSAQLDRMLVSEVRRSLAKYNKPLLIGESGLSAATPDIQDGKITVAGNAPIGIRHAIWAGIVSGAMNGRSLWWEDGVAIYFSNLGFSWMAKYRDAELAAARFVEGVDFSGFKPLTASSSPAVWGAAVGDEEMILGWFRDAACEPPDWNLKDGISGATVTVSAPGTAANWRVDFYDVTDGTHILSTIFLTRQGNSLVIPLPDFKDAIAFTASS